MQTVFCYFALFGLEHAFCAAAGERAVFAFENLQRCGRERILPGCLVKDFGSSRSCLVEYGGGLIKSNWASGAGTHWEKATQSGWEVTDGLKFTPSSNNSHKDCLCRPFQKGMIYPHASHT